MQRRRDTRTAGTQAPSADVARARTRATAAAPRTTRCPCGGGCPTCIGAALDREREADRFAAGTAHVPDGIDRIAPLEPPATIAARLGPGEPLPPSVRVTWENRAGIGLGAVRIHRGERASSLAAAHDAEALTVGSHVAFAGGAYAPTTRAGQDLLGHELGHVIQQSLGGRAIQLRPRRRRPHRVTESDLADDPALRAQLEDPLMFELISTIGVEQGELLEHMTHLSGPTWADAQYRAMQQHAEGAQAALQRMRDSGYTGDGMLDYIHHVELVNANALAVLARAGATAGAFPTVFGTIQRSGNAIAGLRRRPMVHARSEELAEAAEAARYVDPETAAIRELRAWLRRPASRRLLREWPSGAAGMIAEIILRHIERDPESLATFFDHLRERDSRLYDTVLVGGETLHDLRGEPGDVMLSLGRVLLHALMGEWYEGHGEVHSRWDALGRHAFTTSTEEADAEDIISMVLDMAISMIPYVDTAADIRDLGAYLFRMLNLDGAHAGAVSDGWQWFGFVLTLVGFIPEAGTILHSGGRLVQRFGGGAADALRRYAPHLADLLVPLFQRLLRHWDTISRGVRHMWWTRVAQVDRVIESLGVFGRRIGGSVLEQWRRVRAAAVAMIPQSLVRAREMFEQLVRRLGGAIRPVLDRVVDTISTAARPVLDRATRVVEAVQRLTPTGRLRQLDRAFDRVDRARAALAHADPSDLPRLIDELSDALDDLERRASPPVRSGDALHADGLGAPGGRIHGPGSGTSRVIAGRVRQFWDDLRAALPGGARMPEGAASIHFDLDDAEETYRAWFRASPGREVGIWRNASSGEYVVVQGAGDWVNGSVTMPNHIDRWIPIAHYHPELNPFTQYASSADFGALVRGWGGTGSIRSRVSSRIDLRDSLTGRTISSHFGYDPQAVAPFFIDVELPGGGRIEYSFESVEDLYRHLHGVRRDSDIVHALPMPVLPPGVSPTPLGTAAPRRLSSASDLPPDAPAASIEELVADLPRPESLDELVADLPRPADAPHVRTSETTLLEDVLDPEQLADVDRRVAARRLRETLAERAVELDEAMQRAEQRFLDELAARRSWVGAARYHEALENLRNTPNVTIAHMSPSDEVALLRELAAGGGLTPARRGGHLSTLLRGGSTEGVVFLNVTADGELALGRVFVAGAGRYDTTIPDHLRRLAERYGVGEAIRRMSASRRRLLLVVEPARRPGAYATMRLGEELARTTSTTLRQAFIDLAPLAFEGANAPGARPEIHRRLVELLARVFEVSGEAPADRGGARIRRLAEALERFAAGGNARAVEDRVLDLLRFFHGGA